MELHDPQWKTKKISSIEPLMLVEKTLTLHTDASTFMPILQVEISLLAFCHMGCHQDVFMCQV